MAATEREKNNLRLLKAGWPGNEIAQLMSRTACQGSDGESEKSSTLSESDRSDMMSTVSDKMSMESSEEVEPIERRLPNGDLPASVGDMLNYVIEPTLIANASLLGDADNLKLIQDNPRLNKLASTDIYKKPSLVFPCIIEALSWAGQGRDKGVKVLDPRSISQAVPFCLREANHIQILATGSLNFVGGVLHVLSTTEGDIYSG